MPSCLRPAASRWNSHVRIYVRSRCLLVRSWRPPGKRKTKTQGPLQRALEASSDFAATATARPHPPDHEGTNKDACVFGLCDGILFHQRNSLGNMSLFCGVLVRPQEYPSGVCRRCSSVSPVKQIPGNLFHLRTYGPLLFFLLSTLMSLVPPDARRRKRHDRPELLHVHPYRA